MCSWADGTVNLNSFGKKKIIFDFDFEHFGKFYNLESRL